MCKKQLSTFTNQYQLSKTLRFELKHMGETANWIKKHNIIGVKEEKGKSTLIGKDAKKAKHYKYAKKLLDNMHRLFIEDALSVVGDKEHQDKLITPLNEISKSEEYELNKDKGLQKIFEEIRNHTANNWKEEYAKQMPTFWIQEIKDLNIKIANETNKKKIKGYNSAIKAIDKKLVNPLKDIKKNGCALLYSNSEAMHFLEWKVLTGEVTATFKELDQNETNEQLIPKEQLSDFLRGFHKFYSYFSGFNENRQNVYDTSGTKSTAIINRIFIDNFHFHLNNIQKWKTIKKSLEDRKIQESLQENKFDWQSELSEIEAQHNCSFDELMTIDSFIRFMNQSGIDEYNKLLGGSPALDGSRKTQGLNEFTNLCRQKSGSKRYQFPPMQEFYKQILSKSDKTFIPEFNDDHDMLRAIESFYNDTFINQDEDAIVSAFMFDTAILTNELNQDFKNIYLAKDKITSISKELTGHWGNLNSELLEKFDEKIFNKRNEFSFYEIEEVLKFGSSENRFTISESYTDNLVQYFINAFRLK
ncbi:MAG: hypothetical protein KAG26_08715, partial [Methylococcales bacterium]|nr:hypothetical protein [Methylococcales bacterium]